MSRILGAVQNEEANVDVKLPFEIKVSLGEVS